MRNKLWVVSAFALTTFFFLILDTYASEVGTRYTDNGFVCGTSDSGYWSGALSTSWKNYIISTYKGHPVNLGRCPDYSGYVWWQGDIQKNGWSMPDWTAVWNDSMQKDIDAHGGAAGYQKYFDLACLSTAKTIYGSYVIDAKYIAYSGNRCEITVVIPNVNPVAYNVSGSQNEDTTATYSLSAVDSDGYISGYTILSGPSVGSYSVSGGKLSYTPPANWSGTVYVTYYAKDNRNGVSNNAVLTITVNPVNDAPVAQPKASTIDEDASANVTLSATDIDSPEPTNFAVVQTPKNGVAQVTGSVLSYTPNPNWNGIETFTYKAQDSLGAWSNPATVTITVKSVNDPPVVNDDVMAVNEDSMATKDIVVVDPDLTYGGDSHTMEIVEAPQSLTASFSGKKLTVKPATNWNGVAAIRYRAKDAAGEYSNIATITVTVSPVNDTPSLKDSEVTILEDTPVSLSLAIDDVDLQFEGDSYTYQVVTPPSVDSGVVSFDGGSLNFIPAKDWNGTTSVSYRVTDAHGAVSNTATVKINVTWVNDQPSSTGASISAREGMASDHVQPWVVDVDKIYGDTFTFSIAQQPTHGSAKVIYGFLEYTPEPGFTGEDKFRITATDREGLSVDGDVDVTVEKFNYAPTDIQPSNIHAYAGVGASAALTVSDPNLWGSTSLEVVKQPAHGEVEIVGNLLTYRTSGDTDTFVRVRAVDQDGLSIERNISLNFTSAWDMFSGRTVVPTTAAPNVPAVKAQMTNLNGAYALQVSDQEILQALGGEIVAIVTPDSDVGVSLQGRDLAPGRAMRLVPTKLTKKYLEARLGGLNVGVDGKAVILLSRADMTGPVYSVPVHVWTPQASLSADTWDVLQAAGRSNITLSSSAGGCAFFTNESTVRQKNIFSDPACYVSWSKTPDEWKDSSSLTSLAMQASGSQVGMQHVEAEAYVFDGAGQKYLIATFAHDLNVIPAANSASFALKPDVSEVYQSVQELTFTLAQKSGAACDLTTDQSIAIKAAQQWLSRPTCLIRWMNTPNGLATGAYGSSPSLSGVFNDLGENIIGWKASVYAPSGAEIDIGYGSQSLNVLPPPDIEIELPETNLVKEGVYWVSQLGGYAGSTMTRSIQSSITQTVTRNGVELSRNVYPDYGRSQRITEYVEGAEAPLWSLTPFSIEAAYTALPANLTKKEIQLLAVPHEGIVPVILNGEDQVLDTQSLTVNVAIRDDRYPDSQYNLATMGDWDIQLMMSVSGSDPVPVSDWEPISTSDGSAQFELPLDTLTNKTVRLTAVARVRSPVPEYSLFRDSPSPLILSVLNGAPLDSSIQALKIIGLAPLRSSFYAITNDRYEAKDMGDVRWEMSSDGGVTWKTVSSNQRLPQRLTWTFERGSYLLRAEVTNRNSGAKSMTPTIEVIAYIVPHARMKGPANVFIGDSGKFTLTDIQGNDLNTDGVVIEWSEDRGKTWVPGGKSYQVTRNVAARIYLTARLKYADAPNDKRVYKTLRAGVSFRPVRPPRVQIIGPRRPEVGKEATWVANLMMPYPKMDLTMDGEFILPNGEVVHSTEAKYTPTQEDRDKEKSYITVRAWINGYEDKGGIGLTQDRLLFWEYAWPEWTIQNKFSTIYAPAELTMTARSMGAFREFEGLKIEWDIPPYAGVSIIKDGNQVMRILKIDQPGKYTFGMHVSDSRGHYSYAEKNLEFLSPIPWKVDLSWSGDNDANRAPLGVLIRPSITGGHPKDRILSRVYSLEGQPIPTSGDYGRAMLQAEGIYTVSLDIATEMGYTASGSVTIPVNANQSPSCGLDVTTGRTSWLAKASCSDPDGVISRYIWFINGQEQMLSSSSISVPMWRYPDGEPIITVVGVDDSGAESPPVSSQ